MKTAEEIIAYVRGRWDELNKIPTGDILDEAEMSAYANVLRYAYGIEDDEDE